MPEIAQRYVPVLSGRWGQQRPIRKLSRRSVEAARWWAKQHPQLTVDRQAARLAPIYGCSPATMRDALIGRSWVLRG